MLENKLTKAGIHYSSYIESWRYVGGRFDTYEYFDNWLKSEGLTNDEIRDIHVLSFCGGKFELEQSARPFVEKQKKERVEWLKELKRNGEIIRKSNR